MVWEAISKTRKSVSSGFQTPQSRSKNLGCASFFQPTSRDLDILMKHSFSCLIYYFKLLFKYLFYRSTLSWEKPWITGPNFQNYICKGLQYCSYCHYHYMFLTNLCSENLAVRCELTQVLLNFTASYWILLSAKPLINDTCDNSKQQDPRHLSYLIH